MNSFRDFGGINPRAFTDKDLSRIMDPEHYEGMSIDAQDRLRRAGIISGSIAVSGTPGIGRNRLVFDLEHFAHDAPDAEIPVDLE